MSFGAGGQPLPSQMHKSHWPTPEAGAFGAADPERVLERRAAAEKHGNNGFGLTLGQSMALAQWPSPSASDLAGGRVNPEGTSPTGQRPDGKKAQVGLPTAMKSAHWRSPQASDIEKQSEVLATIRGRTGVRQLALNQQMVEATQPGIWPLSRQMSETGDMGTWPTPTSLSFDKSHQPGNSSSSMNRTLELAFGPDRGMGPSGPTPTGCSATTEKRGAPNPAHPCWLMGFPSAWLSGADSATPSSRSSRRK
jgi:hypothetical protein